MCVVASFGAAEYFTWGRGCGPSEAGAGEDDACVSVVEP